MENSSDDDVGPFACGDGKGIVRPFGDSYDMAQRAKRLGVQRTFIREFGYEEDGRGCDRLVLRLSGGFIQVILQRVASDPARVAPFHVWHLLSRPPVGDDPAFRHQHGGRWRRKIQHIPDLARRHVDAVQHSGELSSQDNFHSEGFM